MSELSEEEIARAIEAMDEAIGGGFYVPTSVLRKALAAALLLLQPALERARREEREKAAAICDEIESRCEIEAYANRYSVDDHEHGKAKGAAEAAAAIRKG